MTLNCLLLTFFFLFTVFTADQKILNQGCLCDITNQCDNQCCCDSSCSSSFISSWKTYNLCYDDSLNIPFCATLDNASASFDVNILDLHSGLRMIYQVIKRLLCISKINFVDPTLWYQISVSDNDLNEEITNSNLASSTSALNTNIQNLNSFTIAGLPLTSSNGVCISSSVLTKNYQQDSKCRSYVASSSDVSTNSYISIASIISSLGVASLKTYLTSSPTSISSTSVSSSTLPTTCTGSNCVNVVRQVRLFINSGDGSINSNSYLVVGPLTVDQPGYITIKYSYSFISVQSTLTIFPYQSDVGYQFGTKLQLLYNDVSNSNFYKIFNPINLAFRKQDGSCRTSLSDSSSNSHVQLKFGESQVYSCLGSSSMIYQNLKNSFNYAGIYGISLSNLNDFVSMKYPSTDYANTSSVQLIFYYANIGTPQSNQYQILNVKVNSVANINGLCSLYVQYVSIQNTYSLYVPSPPIVDAYLPNDFLYPFYVV